MRSVSSYLASGRSPAKLLVGVPYSSYEWPTSSSNFNAATTGPGTSRVYTVASTRAAMYGRRWNSNSPTPYFTHGSYAQCWYEDTDSLAAKYDFFENKNVGGIGIWAPGYDDDLPDLWDLIADKFATTGGGGEEEPPPEGELEVTPAPAGAFQHRSFCSTGHGFYANTNSRGWYTGPTLTNGIVEDMGNIDQLNFLDQYCLNAGATIVPFRPVGYQMNEVVLETTMPASLSPAHGTRALYTIFYGSAGDVP